jgi:hypothetical protein
MRILAAVPLLLLAFVAAHTQAGQGSAAAAQARPGWCRPLPVSSGPTVRVGPAQAGSLQAIVSRAPAGATILLANGTYRLRSTLNVSTAGLKIRSASGRPGAVVLDGAYATGDLVAVSAGGVTIAEVTLTRASYHLVHVVPRDGGPTIRGVRLYRLRLIDGAEQFVKVNPNAARSAFVDAGRVECSTFRLTDRGRPHVPSDFLPCYTGGIDAHGARGWVVRLNRFEDIRCDRGLAEHAVHFWTGSRDTLVERNTIVDCARGIGFGLGERTDWARRYPDQAGQGYVGHYGGLIRNNLVVATRPGRGSALAFRRAAVVAAPVLAALLIGAGLLPRSGDRRVRPRPRSRVRGASGPRAGLGARVPLCVRAAGDSRGRADRRRPWARRVDGEPRRPLRRPRVDDAAGLPAHRLLRHRHLRRAGRRRLGRRRRPDSGATGGAAIMFITGFFGLLLALPTALFAAWRAGLLPWWPAVVVLAGGISAQAVPDGIGLLVWAGTLVVLGYVLWKLNEAEPGPQPLAGSEPRIS